ncbi:MAG: hypothetical protein AAGI07_12125 [Bacteroidota bacterium]
MKYSKFFETTRYKYLIIFLIFPLLAQDLILELPVFFQQFQIRKMKGIVKGKVVEVTPERTLRQTLTGNRIIVKGYHVKYSYSFKGKYFLGETYLANGTTQYVNLHRTLFENGEEINIRFDLQNPEKSMIETGYEDIFLSM